MLLRIFIIFILLVTLTGDKAFAGSVIKLPEPAKEGKVSVEQAIQERRSVRSFQDAPLTMEDVSQVLWAAGGMTVDGMTGPTRAYPSAGGLYPLEIYLVAGNVTGLEAGIYRYDWAKHSLSLVRGGDYRSKLAAASWGQRMIREAPATLVITALSDKVMRRYGQRGLSRYVSMDAGHLGQNVHLIAQSRGLGTVMVGAFTDESVAEILEIKREKPVYIMPIGHPR